MKKKFFLGLASLSIVGLVGFTAFTTDDAAPKNDDNLCCPPGWILKCNTAGVANNIDKDKNGDGCLCRKDIPGENANGNNQGPVDARNWKDNNQPCD